MEEQIKQVEQSRQKAENAMASLKQINPCEDCEIKNTSTCCGAPIILHDICSECMEHCDNVCDNCDFKTL